MRVKREEERGCDNWPFHQQHHPPQHAMISSAGLSVCTVHPHSCTVCTICVVHLF